jgi:hypothetical protein
MDPITAVLAFTGLTSSLITIVDTIFEVSKKLLELQQKFKDAPGKIVLLHHDLQNLQALLLAIKARFSGDEAMEYPSALRARASPCNWSKTCRNSKRLSIDPITSQNPWSARDSKHKPGRCWPKPQ